MDALQLSTLSHVENISEPKSLEETGFKYIETKEDLAWLCEHLGKNNRSQVKEIAIDLEHHSYRSYLGFTCLMQISTRQDDFVIDTIKLRADVHMLNDAFTDWTLIKVLHGSDFDIEWLQKDFGLYIVNMFDTGQAARALQYPHFSLSYLLQRYCGVSAQKQFQLADWRQRPLSEDMLKYAREDTHYLLYIYDQLKNELIKASEVNSAEENKLKQVYDKSSGICKKVYKKPAPISKGFVNLCQMNAHLNSKQLKALYDLYKWRDNIARETDESCEYVLKTHQLLKIAELLPREIYGILALCNPLSHVVQTSVHEMHEVIKSAREYKGVFTIADINGTSENANVSTNNVEAGGLNSLTLFYNINY
jgi:exosome complex exonuclease RRP6